MSDVADNAGGPHDGLKHSERRELVRRAHQLSARVAMGRQGLTEPFVAQVDAAMLKCELLKVHIEAESGKDATELGRQLASRIGAQLVQRVGRVALLYRRVAQEERS